MLGVHGNSCFGLQHDEDNTDVLIELMQAHLLIIVQDEHDLQRPLQS